MEQIILSVESLPSIIRNRFNKSVTQVILSGNNEKIMLEPAKNKNKAIKEEHSSLWGMFADGKISSEQFLADKRKSEEETEF